jgi:alkylation response protein AidB-like acyl-CoA dehydrogenase
VAQVAPVIRRYADQGERDRRLAPEVVDAMLDAGVFRAWVPRALGGLEMAPLSAMRLFEGIAHAGGSAGWVASNSINATVAFQAFPEAGAREVFADPRALIAGAIYPPGTAMPVDGGYRVSGHWTTASGCHYATTILTGALIMDGETPRTGPDGNPVLMAVALQPADIEIVENWNTLGMRATGSHDVRARDVFVPQRRTAILGPTSFAEPNAAFGGPLYRIGLWLDMLRIAAAAVGIARAALEAFVELALTKLPTGSQTPLAGQQVVQDQVARAQARIEAGRATVHHATAGAWASVQGGERITGDRGVSQGLAASFGVELAVEAVDIIQGVAGSSGFRAEQPFERYFRDLHTLNQHVLASSARYASLGKMLLGRPSDFPLYYL